MKQGRVVLYHDELNDDFAGNDIKAVEITADFPYERKGFLWRAASFAAYYLIAYPVVRTLLFLSGYSFRGRENVRKLRKASEKGFFLYANHTHWLDAFAAPAVCFPKKAYVLVSPDTVSIKGLRAIVQMLGAIPVPTQRDAAAPFVGSVYSHIDGGDPVMIFPEAHIWPFCSFIRPFRAGSFRYPVKKNVPAVAVCTAYTRHKGLFGFIKAPKRIVFVSEPFYPDASLTPPEAKQKLRDEVFEWLDRTAKEHSDYEYVKYVKAGD